MVTDTREVEQSLLKRKTTELFEKAVDSNNLKLQIKLYKQIITLDPAHARAKNKLADLYNDLACLYLELKLRTKYEIEDDRDTARKYYEQAIKLGQANAKGNLRCLDLQVLSELVKEYQSYGEYYEKVSENNSRINPNGAVVMYRHAINKNEKLVALLKKAERDSCHQIPEEDKQKKYKQMVVATKQKAKENRKILKDKFLKNIEILRSYNKEDLKSLQKDISNIQKQHQMATRYNYLAAMLNRDRRASRLLDKAKYLESPDLKIELYKQAIKLGPVYIDVMYNLARLYLELKPLEKYEFETNRDKAIKYYERAIELGHANAEDDLRRLQGERLKKLAEKSENDLRRLEKEKLEKLAKKYEQEGAFCEKCGDFNQATMKYKQAIAANDEWMDILNSELSHYEDISEKNKRKIDFEKNFVETSKLLLQHKISLLRKAMKEEQDRPSRDSIRTLCERIGFLCSRGDNSYYSDDSNDSDDSDDDEYAHSSITPS